jgi:hypothetical protein
MLLGDNGGILTATGRARFLIAQHQGMESYLGRYAGLILYLKEMDESIYAKLCAVRIVQFLRLTLLKVTYRLIFLLPVNFTAHK